MKKTLSLFLALVMALSLCVTAFAGNATGSTVLRLTGDAANQVVDLKSGQRLSADSSTLVRLNVLNDPSAEEYTVMLDGEKLTPDHSTSQYHFYAVPAAKRPGVATLNVSTQAAEGVSVTVKVGNAEKTVALSTGGSTDVANPTAVTVKFENPGSDAAMDRIYFDKPEGVTLGTGFSNGAISGELTKLDAGYTGNQLFFYKAPVALKQSVKAIWNDGTDNHYYTITVNRAVQEGYALACMQLSAMNESSPYGASAYTSGSEYISGMYAPYAYFGLYKDGKNVQSSIQPSFPKESDAFYYINGMNVYFARPGRYWIPASVEKDGVTYEGEAPFLVTWNLTALKAHLEAAKTVQVSDEFKTLPESVQAQFNAVVDRLTAGSANMSGNVMLTADGKIAGDGDTATDIQARDLGGKQIFTERLLEGDECALLDLMAIFETYKTNKALGQYQAEAYAKIAALNVNSFTDVTTAEQKTLYSQVKQAKWDMLKTTDLEGINAILTKLGLDNITPAKPQVTLGDVDGNGEINMDDAALLIRYCNNLTTLTDEQKAAAELNGNGEINMDDAALLIRYCNNLLASFQAQN